MPDKINIVDITPFLKLIELRAPIPGFERFLGTYLFSGEQKAIVEVGPRSAISSLLAALEQLGVAASDIDYVILTHIHLDHASGIGTILKLMPRAKVIVHPRARPHLVEPSRLWQSSLATIGEIARQYGEVEPVPAGRIIEAADGVKIALGKGIVLEIYLTPGHAPHHLSIFERGSGVLLAGEAAGVCINGSLRPTTPPPFRMEDTLASLDRLIALAPQKICYAHFGCYDNPLPRMEQMRQKLLDWQGFIRTEAGRGKNPDEILLLLRKKDPGLNYLDTLSPGEYEREYALILNSVKGMYLAISPKSIP
ncbi:MAG: MBL fold metallo-hydrolase [Dehalococcoidales bacterium]|nr:MBL fold metallo-hydrolase [Dehalococcoidales bacterium]